MKNSSLEKIDYKLFLFLQEMITQFDSGTDAEWDLHLEKITLGGALMLRCELEMIALHCNLKTLNFNYVNHLTEPGSGELLQKVLNSSDFSFSFSNSKDSNFGYPAPLMGYLQDFSYFSSTRITALHSFFNSKPILKWNSSVESLVTIQHLFGISKFAVIHLKNMGSFETSKANMATWIPIITQISRTAGLPLLLIGDDNYPKELTSIHGVLHLNSFSIPLMAQLALTSKASYFIGSASGVAASAIFSDTPYLIFKDPRHHKIEMNKELGDSNHFPWAGPNQFIHREEPSEERLESFIRGLSYDAD